MHPTQSPSSIILSPSDLGLPAKFPTWRPGQWEAIDQTSTLPHRFIAQSAPTGFGKSPYAIACAMLDGGRAVYTTATKALQKQLMDDFHSCGLFDIRGRQNYTCVHAHDCNQGRLMGCEEKELCPATAARKKFLESRLNVTNYDFILASTIHGEGIGEVSLLILDEAHDAVQQLSDAIEIHLPHKPNEIWYRHFNAYPPLDGEPTLDRYRDWAKSLLQPVAKYRELTKDGDAKLLASITNFQRVVASISEVPQNWILDLSKREETVIAPLWPTDYAEKYLFPGSVARVLLVSATIVPKTLQLLGIRESDSVFLSQDHTFDPRRSPVYLFGPHRVNAKNTDQENQIWLGRLDTILARRIDRKGIIHTTSYDRQQFIVNQSEFGHRMIAPRSARELASCLEEFRMSGPGAILVSPSVTTGYDFPGDQAEYQILCKMPFIDSRGPVMSARSEADPEYMPYLMAQTIVQTCGRGMRFNGDQCENFILDKNANWFFNKKEKGGYRHLFPPWFMKQVQYPDFLPVPPPAL